jgi:hypothetical protein
VSDIWGFVVGHIDLFAFVVLAWAQIEFEAQLKRMQDRWNRLIRDLRDIAQAAQSPTETLDHPITVTLDNDDFRIVRDDETARPK